MRLLLVEDDRELSTKLKSLLVQHGFAVDCSYDGIDGEFLGNENLHDIAILDLGLPLRNGLDVLRNWREHGNIMPVLVLTARDAWHEKVDGFKAGADDYLGKPFHPEELLARVTALLRRSADKVEQHLKGNGLTLDEEKRCVRLKNNVEKNLTGTEFRLLRYLMLNPNKVLSKSRLAEHIYDADFDHDSNLIEVYIRRLREKTGKQTILTKRGQGYIFPDQLS